MLTFTTPSKKILSAVWEGEPVLKPDWTWMWKNSWLWHSHCIQTISIQWDPVCWLHKAEIFYKAEGGFPPFYKAEKQNFSFKNMINNSELWYLPKYLESCSFWILTVNICYSLRDLKEQRISLVSEKLIEFSVYKSVGSTLFNFVSESDLLLACRGITEGICCTLILAKVRAWPAGGFFWLDIEMCRIQCRSLSMSH